MLPMIVATSSQAEFPILQVDAEEERTEPIGSKTKAWFRREGSLWLFKHARPETGEDWAEKIAAEIADRLGLPHAVVELAQYQGKPGILTSDFTEGQRRGNLVHGNELLFASDPEYPKQRRFRVPQHTLAAVRHALDDSGVALPNWSWPKGVTTPWEAFIGYIMLDALICNTDRHHQNWGVLVRGEDLGQQRDLAPTFDHASSLGRELTDEQRARMMTTRDTRGDLRAYVARARSALHDSEGRVLKTTEAFQVALAASSVAGRAWLGRLPTITPEFCESMVARVPRPTMSDQARRFALAFLIETRTRLEALFA
jgi:hypothetical protein